MKEGAIMKHYICTFVTINGLEWNVITEDIDSTNIGLADYRNLTITLDETVAKDVLIRTLKHELTHAIIYSYGLDQIGKFNQEVVCDFMANYSGMLNDLAQQILNNGYTELQERDDQAVEFEEDIDM